jgi:aspartyl-tRNA(Asn)/glutamyl-tRNA(Gln) amidotransferase subunit A
MAEELSFQSARQLAQRVARKEISPVELVEAFLSRVEQLDGRLGAYITVTGDEAIAAARRAEQAILAGEAVGPLHGIPIALKDNIATRGIRTTAGSRILAEWVPDEDAAVAERLRAAGTVCLGKTNLHEFAYGGTSTNPHYGAARNPWDRERVPGGSSGGSAAAVAAGLCVAAVGTDTAGSVRLPACQCGVVGLKPTYGRVSRFGITPLAWSLDHAGPITRSVEDAALMLEAMAGPDPRDASTVRAPLEDVTARLDGDVKGLRLGVPTEFFFEGLDAEVEAAVRRAIAALEGLGATVQAVELPSARYSNSATWTIILAEASSYHRAWLRTRGAEYGADVRANLQQGEFLPATDYLQAQRVRTVMRREVRAALERVDALVAPMLAIVSPKIGQETVRVGGKERPINPVFIRLAAPFNLTGLPALAVPCGFSRAGLPIGLQLAGRPFDEATVLRLGYAYEQSTDWHRASPPL